MLTSPASARVAQPARADSVDSPIGWVRRWSSLLRRHGQRPESTTTVTINGRQVAVSWTDAAARALAARPRPLVLELELYFSCLVKKTVHLHDAPVARPTVAVTAGLELFFRPVTSTACTMELAERLGRQPETELHTAAVARIAPRAVRLDHVGGRWQAGFWI